MRGNIAPDGTPIQQSMTQDPADYRDQNLNILMLGVVLEVYPSDDEDGNSTSRQTLERRGHTHECTVLVLQDGSSTYMHLPNVVITPDAPSGIDDYSERLPRGSTGLTTGGEMNSSMHQINPYDLDGDWCVVGFIGGQIDRPFIVRWWPHARNILDPATSGRGNPDSSGAGRALDQQGRYFRRINGVETVITSTGDIYISTTFAGGQVQLGQDPVKGRFSRSEVDEGGDVRIYMKPSRSLEWTWDPQPDGVGVQDSAEPELPQTNPASNVTTTGTKDNTYIVVDQERCRIQVPTNFEVISKDKVLVEASNSVSVESKTGTVEITAATMLDLIAQAITLGENGTDALVKGTTLNSAWQAVSLTLSAVPAAADPVSVITLANANKAAILGMIAALASALSTTSKTL